MAFVVEDGTGLPDSNSYVDISYIDSYFESRGGHAWVGNDELKQQHLILASDYADQKWSGKLLGFPLKTTQALSIPRSSAYDKFGAPLTGVPTTWKKAICEYSLASLLGKLKPEETSVNGKEIKKKKTVVGPITTEIEYEDSLLVETTSNSVMTGDSLVKALLGNRQTRAIR
jgi:hypothetical protein